MCEIIIRYISIIVEMKIDLVKRITNITNINITVLILVTFSLAHSLCACVLHMYIIRYSYMHTYII